MFRNDDATAAVAIPTPTTPGTPGYFTGGNPATATPATIVTEDWLNSVQEELMSILAAGGQTPSKTTYNQVLTAIQALITSSVSGASVWCGSTGGTANAPTFTPSPAVGALIVGALYIGIATATNTGASTLNISGLGVKTVEKDTGAGPVALTGGEIVSGDVVGFRWDGTIFHFQGTTLGSAAAKTASDNSQTNVASVKGAIVAGNVPKFMDTNGTQGDSGVSAAALLPPMGQIFGLYLSTIGATTATVASGQAVDSSGAVYLTLASPFSWTVATGNAIGGFQGGTTIPNVATIHFALCGGASGVGVFSDTQLPVRAPTGYTTWQRRIDSVPTAATGNQFHAAYQGAAAREMGGGALRRGFSAVQMDVNGTTIGSTRSLLTVTAPTGINTQILGRGYSPTNSTSVIRLSSPDDADIGPIAGTTGPYWDAGGIGGIGQLDTSQPFLICDTSARIGARSEGSAPLYFETFANIDFRRI